MTDNDDSNSPRDRPSRPGSDEHERPDEARPHGVRVIAPSAKGAHAAPTDPEVPSAKRRGALRQQRSLIGLAAVVLGLLSMTLSLLYRAGRSVGTSENAGRGVGAASPSSTNGVPPPRGSTERERSEGREAWPASHPLPDLPDRSLDDDAAAGSSAPASKNPPPATDIIRAPAF